MQTRYLQLRPPSERHLRGDNVLLVWGDLPHWMVVDRECDEFLSQFDGKRSDTALIAGRPELRAMVDELLGRGVLRRADQPDTLPPPAEPPQIENVTINLTRRCSLTCAHCYLPASDACPEINAAQIERFLHDVRPLCSDQASLVILGGEPTLEPQKLLSTLTVAAQLGFQCLISTNAQQITPALARALAAQHVQVQVSLDGATAATNDTLRGSGSFVRARQGAQTLIAAGAHVILSMVVTQRNRHELRAYLDLALSLRSAEARFIPLRAVGAAAGLNQQIVSLSSLIGEIRDLLRQCPQYRPLLRTDAFSVLGHTCRLSQRRISCGTGRQTLLLDADGRLYPCANLNHEAACFGSIQQGNLAKLWTSSPALHDVRAATAVPALQPPCGTCAVRYWCLGGCRGEALAAGGSLSAPSPHCAELHRSIIDLFWTLAESPELIHQASARC